MASERSRRHDAADEGADRPSPGDAGPVILTCANRGARMVGRTCALVCEGAYFLSCLDDD